MSQTQRISKNNTVILKDNGITTVMLHSTPVVTINENTKTVLYNNGGYVTHTTATRMNQAGNEYNLAYRVGRKKGVMEALDIVNGEKHVFNGYGKCLLPLKYCKYDFVEGKLNYAD